MGHIFIHAPIGNGLDGALLYYDHKPTKWTKAQIEDICDTLFWAHDSRDDLIIHNDNNVTVRMVEGYMLRAERGMMQRYSSSETFEDLHFDEWLKRVRRECKWLTRFAAFMASVNHAKDGTVLHAVV